MELGAEKRLGRAAVIRQKGSLKCSNGSCHHDRGAARTGEPSS